ncbi:MAG: HDOD domain-containing protein [Thermodesulfobacteriota bacterium]
MRVADLRPGMTLGEAVRDVNGRLLMGEGTSLSERFIGVLKAWGIGEVAVTGESPREEKCPWDAAPEDLEGKARELVEARLALNMADHPFLRDVRGLALARTAALLGRGLYPFPPPRGPEAGAAPELPPLDIRALTGADMELGAMPEILSRLAQAMEDPSASPVEVAQIIMNDPGLTAKLLKVVNSAMYGFPQRIDTISRAVTVIGVQQLSALALGLTVMDLFKDVDKSLLDLTGFWRHCLACACGARALASLLGQANTERYFVAGLLHDVGLLLLILHAPGRVRPALEAARSGEGLIEAERRILGVDHAGAGAALLKSWRLPPSLVTAAACHHDPLCCAGPRDPAIVHVADFLAEAIVFGSGGQGTLMPLNLAAFDLLGAPGGVAGMVFERVDAQLGQLESIFLSNAAS